MQTTLSMSVGCYNATRTLVIEIISFALTSVLLSRIYDCMVSSSLSKGRTIAMGKTRWLHCMIHLIVIGVFGTAVLLMESNTDATVVPVEEVRKCKSGIQPKEILYAPYSISSSTYDTWGSMTRLRNTSQACIVEMTENSDDGDMEHTMKLEYRETIMDDKLIPRCVGDIKHKEYSYRLPTLANRTDKVPRIPSYGVILREVVNRTFQTILGGRGVELSSKNGSLDWADEYATDGDFIHANCYLEKDPGLMAETYSSWYGPKIGREDAIFAYASCSVSFSNGEEWLLSGLATTDDKDSMGPGVEYVHFTPDAESVTFYGSDVDLNSVAREGGILVDNPSRMHYSFNRMYPEDIILFDILKPERVAKACPPNGRFMAVVGTKLVARISGWAELLVAAIVAVVSASWLFAEYSKKHITVMTIEQRLTSSLKSEVTGKGCNEKPKNCRFGLTKGETYHLGLTDSGVAYDGESAIE